MRSRCLSCGARYDIPDRQVDAAGPAGLRVRCARCRAIMCISRGDGDDTGSELPELRRKRSAPAASAALSASLGVGAAPAALSSSGVYRPLPGVERDVTGLHIAAAGKDRERCWYAGIGGRARGPYTEAELVYLARQGRVRGSTLVWRPGFSGWKRVRSKDGECDLSWLYRVVRERKRRERQAAERAQQELGIHRIQLFDGPSLSQSGRAPPPIPADDEGLEGAAADRVFGPPSLGTPSILTRAHRRPSPWVRRAKLVLAGALGAALVLIVAFYTLPHVSP